MYFPGHSRLFLLVMMIRIGSIFGLMVLMMNQYMIMGNADSATACNGKHCPFGQAHKIEDKTELAEIAKNLSFN